MKMRSSRVAASLVSAIVAAGALAASAHAQEFSADFTTDAEGFDLFEVHSNGTFSSGPLTHSMSGGNPDGFIRWQDLDSGASEKTAWFIPPIEIDPEQIGMAISFDVRSTGATPEREAFIEVGDRENPQVNGLIRCEFGVPDASWTTHSVAISPADPCWRDALGGDAGSADFDMVFDTPTIVSAWVLGADFAPQAGELSDLDNFALEEWVVGREITLKYKKRSQLFSGVVTQEEGASTDGCTNLVAVHLFQIKGGVVNLIDGDLTDPNGKFKIARKARRNKQYFAVAPKFGEGPSCAAVTSEPVEPR
jgi:hypothetical protein